MKLSNNIIGIVENNGFSIHEVEKQGNDFYVEINQGTPLGEDWWETIWFDGTDKGFINGVKDRNRENITIENRCSGYLQREQEHIKE